jgi:hypothetical protein
MIGGVSNGQYANQTTFNEAFIARNNDSDTVGRLTLKNELPESGGFITSIQREANSLNSFTGKLPNTAKDEKPVYLYNNGFAEMQDLRTRLDEVSYKFDFTAGHMHTGADGDAPPITPDGLTGYKFKGFYIAGIVFEASTNGQDLTSQLSSETPSTDDMTLGVVVNAPYNRVIIRKAINSDLVVDEFGNEVFGRLEFDAGVWNLFYFVDLDGVETSFSFASPLEIKWYYQKIFDPLVNAPVYSEMATIPSENATEDVAQATEIVSGKSALANVDMLSVSSTNNRGMSSRVAKADHTHQGIHKVSITGQALSDIFGDLELAEGSNITLTKVGNRIEIASAGGGGGGGGGYGVTFGFQQTLTAQNIGRTIYGTLSRMPIDNASIVVFVDGAQVSNALWAHTGGLITFVNPQAVTATVRVFYLYNGLLPAFQIEYRTITNDEFINARLILGFTPADPTKVLVDSIGGCAQVYGDDFIVVGNQLRWLNLGLDQILVVGSKLRVHYLT